MQIFSNQTSKEQRQLWAILSPSVLSLVVSLVVILVVVGGTIFLTVYRTSDAPGFISNLSAQTAHNKSLSHTYSATSNFLNGKTAFSDAPLTLFWALVGVGVYALVISLGGLVKNVAETERETQYVHVKKEKFVRLTVVRLAIRLLAIVLAWFVILGLIKYVFPYAVAASHVASQGNWTQHITYALTASFTLLIGLHVLVVVLRLIWLRVRLFT